MTTETAQSPEQKTGRGFTGMQVLGLVVGSMLLSVFATAFAIKLFLFPGPFKPVVLSDREARQLETKLAVFEGFGDTATQPSEHSSNGKLKPEMYSEEGSSREITFTERELNAMVAKNTDLAETLAIDLAENLVSVKLLIPLDPDFPMLGGKTLRVKAGAELAYREGRPVVKLMGVSLMGVPVPNAWLGGIKNIDLIREFGMEEGFWKTFADGIESISVIEGFMKIRFKE
jgi:hypothetical protein